MAKGDSIEVYVRGVPDPIIVRAVRSGRKLVTEFDKDGAVQWFLVHEKTWTDRNIKTTRFAVADMVAVVDNRTEVE